MFFCVVAASSPGQLFFTLFHAHDPQTSDMAKSRIMRRCFGAMGNRNLASRPIHDVFLENKTMLKPLHLQKFSPASLRTLGSLDGVGTWFTHWVAGICPNFTSLAIKGRA